MMIKIVILTLSVTCLTACVSNPVASPTQYYLLEGAPARAISLAGNDEPVKRVAFARIRVAAYLDQPNLVMKQSDHRIIVANFHVWAEPLPGALRRTIMRDLAIHAPDITLVDRCTDCETVSLQVDHLYPQQQGDTVFSGRYIITKPNGSSTEYAFTLRAELGADGYEAAVKTMRSLVEALSMEIAAKL